MREQETRLTALEKVFMLIFERAYSSESKGAAYLQSCGIPLYLQMEAYRRGMLRFLPSDPRTATQWLCVNVGEDLLWQAGLWDQGKTMPGIAFRPIVFLQEGRRGGQFMAAGEGEQASLCFLSWGVPLSWQWGGSHIRGRAFRLAFGFMEFLRNIAAYPRDELWICLDRYVAHQVLQPQDCKHLSSSLPGSRDCY